MTSPTGMASPPAPSWNHGAWFGTQFGCTSWLLILGLVLLPRDATAAGTALGAFAATTIAGVALWRRRTQCSYPAALQILLAVLTVATAITVAVVNARGASDLPGSGVSTWLPWWTIAIPPALMAWFFLIVKKHPSMRSDGPR